MKKIGDLMRDMGFREDASQSAKEAFMKNLIKSATGNEIETPSERRKKRTDTWTEQLSFDLGPGSSKKKVG